MEEIFVAIMCIFVFGIGAWTWWYENYSPVETPEKEENCETDSKNV